MALFCIFHALSFELNFFRPEVKVAVFMLAEFFRYQVGISN